MKKSILKLFFTGAFIALCLAACERRPLENAPGDGSVLIPVKIDWSKSGIPVSEPSGGEYVHRVSIRFFPKDGSAPFDRYLEGNVVAGRISVPVGRYSVVAYNESVDDPYWSDAIVFTGTNDYSAFAANVIDDDPASFYLYEPMPGEKTIVEPLRLASWSLDYFEVTPMMGISALEPVSTALEAIVMRPLTRNVNVLAEVENLRSAYLIEGALRGFANRVYMASGATEQVPTTHVFRLNGRKWSTDNPRNGTTEKNFLSFGRLPQASPYALGLGVLFVTGEKYEPSDPLLYDVSGQVDSQVNSDIDVRVKLVLPLKEGGIDVGDWEDEEHDIN